MVLPMVLPWFCNGFAMVLPVVLPMICCGFAMVLLWFCHGVAIKRGKIMRRRIVADQEFIEMSRGALPMATYLMTGIGRQMPRNEQSKEGKRGKLREKLTEIGWRKTQVWTLML